MGSNRVALCIPLLLTASSSALAQTTWFVDTSAAPPGNGSPGSPYVSIQYAHDQAATLSGDTFSIAAGNYDEILTFAQGKALRLVGAGTAQTHLRGGLDVQSVGGLTRVENLAFEIERVRFQQSDAALTGVLVNGVRYSGVVASVLVIDADSTWTDVIMAGNPGGGAGIFGGTATISSSSFVQTTGFSGGLFASGATLSVTDSFFGDNHVSDGHGGGMYLDNCQTTLLDCDFEDNSAYVDGRYGGALYQAGGQLSITGGEFKSNSSDRGGALALFGAATVSGATFQANVAVRDGTGMFQTGQGGAIYVGFQGTLTADDCDFLINSAPASLALLPDDQVGGAVFAVNAGSTVSNSLFEDNYSGQTGSAVHGPVTLVRCRILKNVNTSAGGAVQGTTLDRCTVIKNGTGFGTAAVLDSTVAGSIVWANANGQLGGTSSATWSCIQGGAAGVGNIAADPQFVDLSNEVVTLTMPSPCIDTASPTAPVDPDGTPADMGALPFTWLPIGSSYCVANVNSSGLAAQMELLGTNAVADDFLRLRANSTAVNQLGLFIMSQNQGFVPLFGGSQGNLCVSAPIFRLTNTPGSVSSSGATGTLQLRLGLTTLPSGLMVLPGQTWHFQSWFRDNVGGNSTSNTSDAVSVTFQ